MRMKIFFGGTRKRARGGVRLGRCGRRRGRASGGGLISSTSVRMMNSSQGWMESRRIGRMQVLRQRSRGRCSGTVSLPRLLTYPFAFPRHSSSFQKPVTSILDTSPPLLPLQLHLWHFADFRSLPTIQKSSLPLLARLPLLELRLHCLLLLPELRSHIMTVNSHHRNPFSLLPNCRSSPVFKSLLQNERQLPSPPSSLDLKVHAPLVLPFPRSPNLSQSLCRPSPTLHRNWRNA
jgi:hypothetical protein